MHIFGFLGKFFIIRNASEKLLLKLTLIAMNVLLNYWQSLAVFSLVNQKLSFVSASVRKSDNMSKEKLCSIVTENNYMCCVFFFENSENIYELF